MRRFAFLLSLGFAACAPNPAQPLSQAAPVLESPGNPSENTGKIYPDTPGIASPTPDTPAVSGPVQNPRFTRTHRSEVTLEAVSYDSRSCRAVIVDQKAGPGSQWVSSKAVGQSRGALAAINAGFFTPEGKPLGRVISQGSKRGAVNRSSSLGAGYYTLSPTGAPALVRRERFRMGKEALQSGPFLVENGRAVGGLSEKSSTARSLIATDGANGWLLIRTGPCSLRQLAAALAGSEINGVRVRTALNLDGGRSSDLWVSGSVQGGPANHRPLWNKPVRNFLVLKKN